MIRVGTANIRDTLPADKAERSLRKVLAAKPTMLTLPEWTSRRRPILEAIRREGDYRWARPEGGGAPLVYDARFTLRSARTVKISPLAFVGRLPGRKSTLPPSLASVYVLEDEDGDEYACIGFHFTAEVQKGKGYRRTLSHARRVARHKLERYRVGRIASRQRKKGRRPFPAGDTNFEGMEIDGLKSCWDGRRSPGTLGNRTVDVVYGDRRATDVDVIETDSDHDAVIAEYP